ncbi:uncharacterized protein LOC108652495 [Drosophila navojoa]|uniref:uncharacterized protein LOC108652495 n=1 Tax=Drosophila navojoa TaxID=7232 RepID=UPI0008473A56|nr:uncharacterized protein LOC108652495 [Drosophila navojoa]
MYIAAVGQLLLILLVSAMFASSWAATIVHTPKAGQAAGSAISHQSFVRLSTAPQPQLILATPTVRIVNAKVNKGLEVPEVHHTPAHLTYAAHPVVHQTLPRIKPVRNISYASLRAQSHPLAHTHAHTQLQLV